jgi:small subunit ribosomal protein S20
MPNIKSAKKRVLVSEANYQRNKAYRSALKTALKKADAAIEANAEDKEATVKVAVKKLDQAAVKGILHSNAVARKKSQVAKRLNKA